MNPDPDVPDLSIIVVSRHRPALLLRALAGLAQQDHPRIEVIVVADPEASGLVQARGFPVRTVSFDQANVAAARNAGLVLAGAPVVAYLDDDAVPEPTWAARLAAPFADARVMQAGGFVRGRNGISFQWRAMEVDATGRDHPLEVPEHVTLHRGSALRTVKTQGTNCAFRRNALLAVGGFDPAFRYYLDDADLNLRLAAQGGLTAVVPLAQVHHGFAASDRRRVDRAPLSLRDIGASTAIFLRRHAPERAADALDGLREAQRQRLVAMMEDGRLEPCDVGRLFRTLEQGIAEGGTRPLNLMHPLRADGIFLRYPGTGPRPGRVIAGPLWQPRRLARRATEASAQGAVVTVLGLGLLPRRHRMWFDPSGFWWQVGGLTAASDRSDPRWRLWGWHSRVARETRRLKSVRPTSPDRDRDCLSERQPANPEATGRIDSEMSSSPCNSVLDRRVAGAYELGRRMQPVTG